MGLSPRDRATMAGVARLIAAYKVALERAKDECSDDVGRLAAALEAADGQFYGDMDVFIDSLPDDQILLVYRHLRALLWERGVAPQSPSQRN